MSRGLPSEVLTLLSGQSYGYEFFVELVFSTATINLWTGLGSIEWGGKTWLGNGFLEEVAGYGETSGKIVSPSFRVILSGLPPELAYYALNEASQDRRVNAYIGFLNTSDVLIHVQDLYTGVLDTSDMEEGGTGSTISISYVDPLFRSRTDREARWTPEEHKSRFPGDLGFDYVPFLQQQRIYWGRPDTTRQR